VTIPVELKYKTDSATVEDAAFDESFEFASQGAQSDAHYRVFRDIKRIENVVDEQGRYGYFVLLTNDSNYWSAPSQSSTALHDAFRIHEGRSVEGTLEWRDIRGWIADNGMADPIELRGRYQMVWADYSYRGEISVQDNPVFRHLVVRVDSAGVRER
jgi:hypothetical protein